jgi:hypothetical protein
MATRKTISISVPRGTSRAGIHAAVRQAVNDDIRRSIASTKVQKVRVSIPLAPVERAVKARVLTPAEEMVRIIAKALGQI